MKLGRKKRCRQNRQKGDSKAAQKKGDLSDCNNWRSITLLLVPGKVFCKVLLNRLQTEVDRTLREEQAGFRSWRSCSEQIFTLQNSIEQIIEFQKSAIVNFIDFRKAFDGMHRPILPSYGIPEKHINIFKNLYKNISCCIKTAQNISKSCLAYDKGVYYHRFCSQLSSTLSWNEPWIKLDLASVGGKHASSTYCLRTILRWLLKRME